MPPTDSHQTVTAFKCMDAPLHGNASFSFLFFKPCPKMLPFA